MKVDAKPYWNKFNKTSGGLFFWLIFYFFLDKSSIK